MSGNKFKTIGLLVVAIILGGVAVGATNLYLENREAQMLAAINGQGGEKIAIVVPKFNLNAGDTINSDVMSVREIPAEYLPDNYIAPGDFSHYAGLTLSENISEGRPLLRSSIVGLSGARTFSQLLEKQHRAFTFNIDEVQSNASMLEAGDHIDLLLRLSDSDEQETNIADPLVLLLENVAVLATGTRTIADAEIYWAEGEEMQGYSSISIGVNLKDISSLITAKQLVDGSGAQFIFLLRHPEDELHANYPNIGTLTKKRNTIESFAGGKSEDGVLVVKQTLIDNLGSVSETNKSESEAKDRKFQKFKKI